MPKEHEAELAINWFMFEKLRKQGGLRRGRLRRYASDECSPIDKKDEVVSAPEPYSNALPFAGAEMTLPGAVLPVFAKEKVDTTPKR